MKLSKLAIPLPYVTSKHDQSGHSLCLTCNLREESEVIVTHNVQTE